MKANQYLREVEVKFKTKPKNDQKITIGNPTDAVKFFTDLQDETQEKIIVLYLNQRNSISCFQIVSIGTSTAAVIDPKDILRTALLTNSQSIIALHNHPSGDPKPSDADIQVKHQLQTACNALDIQLLDCIIIGDAGLYFSFNEKGILKKNVPTYSKEKGKFRDEEQITIQKIKQSRTKGHTYICRKCGAYYFDRDSQCTCQHDFILQPKEQDIEK